MRKIREILRLGLKCHRSNREIARSLRISHVTVGRYLLQAKEAGLAHAAIEEMNDLRPRKNIIILGPPGVGKSHLAL